MDKAKIYLALLIKYHFWVLSSLVLIIGLSGWGIATAALANYYKTQRAKIDAEFAKMQAITRKDNHPNKTFEEGVDKLLNAPGPGGLKTSVLRAWTLVYDEQKNQVLKWPAEMGDDFLQHVQDKGPENEIAVNYRERYQNYIKAEFPRLVKIVSAEPHSGTPIDAVDAGAEGKPKEAPVYIVNWRSANQREIDDALDWARPPTTKELLYVQENLWVYHALLDIIAKVNETATGHYNAKIKNIHTLAIARQAAQEFQAATAPGKIYLPAGQSATTTSQSASQQQQQAGFDGRGGAGSAALSAVQDERRYVDAKGQPLAAGAAGPPEFKRMPIYLRFMMDQREVSLLLAECANSPLPVEVHQVRINPAALRRGNRTVSPSMFGSSRRGSGGGGGGGGGGSTDNAGADQDLSAYDMPIEVFGIIYIYNRPNRAKLDVIGQAGAEAPATGQPDAGAPAAGIPAAPGAPPTGQPATEPAAVEKPAVGGPPVDNPAEAKPAVPAPAAAENPAAASTAPVGGGTALVGGGTAPAAEGTAPATPAVPPAAPAVPASPPGEPAAAAPP